MAQSRLIELALLPYAVILQVTPIIAAAPLIIIYAPSTDAALLIIAWIVAFFPILSNTAQGLRSTDHNLLSLFDLYGASRWQALIHLKLPNALPYFLAGLRIAGGLALIAAVVAEFAAGNAGEGSGLAFRLLEAQYRLEIPRLYAALRAPVADAASRSTPPPASSRTCCCGAGTRARRAGNRPPPAGPCHTGDMLSA